MKKTYNVAPDQKRAAAVFTSSQQQRKVIREARSSHYPKNHFLFLLFFLPLVIGMCNLGMGQTKSVKDNLVKVKKDLRIQQAALQSDIVSENNQIPETEGSNDVSFENNQMAEPPLDAPLASITSAATGNWSATAWPNTGRTGTITTSTSFTTVTGSGTLFLTEISVGNIIKNTSNTVIGTVSSVTSNTSLTLTSNAASTNTGIAYRSQGVGSGDAIIIANSHTITVDVAGSCASITFAAITSANSAITISGTNSLTVSGAVSMPRPAAGYTCTINVNAGTMSIGTSLTMSATTIETGTRTDVINITTGSLTVSGNITCGTTGCIFNISSTGTMNFGGTFSSTPTLTTVTGSIVNYTSASAQTLLALTYSGNLGLSGAGTKTIAASTTVTVNGNITNSSTLVLTAGTSTTSTWLRMGGNVTNTGTITATAAYIRFIFSSANAQTFTNNGTVTSPVYSFDVANSNASGLTLAGTGFNVTRANLFYGSVTNSNKITLGTGGTSSAVVQRGVAANTSPAGSFDVAPNFNVGTGGLILLYGNGSVAYNTGYEVPGSSTCALFYIFDAADVTLNSDLIISSELNFYGGTGTPILRIGAHTLTLGGTITYTVAGAFYGGATSNLVMNGSTTLNAITNGLNNLTVNNSGGITLGGAVTVNGTLTLTDGILTNGANLTMASGTTISRTATGILSAAPAFGTSVNVIYTGSSAVNTGYEIPTSATILTDLTTNTGGVTQSGTPSAGTVSTIYTQGFNAAPADWTTEIVTNPAGTAPAIAYVTSAASTYPAVTFTEGGIGVQFNSYYCESGDQIRLKKNSSPLTTAGKTNITVVFDWYVDPGYSTSNDYVTVQWSVNGTTWNNSTSYYRYNATASWVTQNCVLPAGAENQTTLYVAFLFTSLYGNNCHLDNMKVNVTTPGTPTPSTCTVNGTIDLTSGAYSIGATNSLVLNGGLSGTNAIAGSATSNLSIGGTGSALVIPSVTGGLNNFTISRANGVTLKSDATVNGVLSLTTNASSTKGSLDMLDGSTMKSLTMGASATTNGAGDVTGIVKRTTPVAGTPYTFGNQFTTVNFQNTGTLPSDVSVKITLGSAPSWKTNAIKRTYDFIHTGGISCYATVEAHYLDSELNGNAESSLSWWGCDTPFTPGTEVEYGRSNYDETNNWVGLSSVPLSIWPTSFGTKVETFGATGTTDFTWDGSFDTDWLNSANWTPVGVPTGTSDVVIPDASTTPNDPTLYTGSSAVQTLTIESEGILNSAATSSLTMGGGSGAWINQGGTFNPSTGTVTFTNADATIAGTTNFYNLTISSGAALVPGSNSTTRIAGTMTNSGTWRAALNPDNTVEYNGGNQTVLNPNAPIPGYRNLILSGTGTKTMPGSALSIAEDLSLSGSASAAVADALTVGGNVTIGSGTTLNMGSYSHTISGDVTNNGGTFTPSSCSITLDGTGSQTITSSAGISFNNLSITNTSAAVLLGASTNCTIGGNLTISSGAVFDLAANSLTAVTGTLSNSGTVKTQSTSGTPVPAGKTWGGTFEYTGSAAQTIVAGTYNNLTMTGAGGATAGADITVNGILNLSSANPSLAKGILDMGSNTVLMGPSATTIGQGDVSGIIRRTTIVHSTTYSFGNQYSTIYFPNVGTLPSEISLKVSLGTAPTWKTGAIKRIYDLIQTGGSGTQALISCHYLDAELNENNEDMLVDWLHIFSPATTLEYGRSDHNATDNWVVISNVNVGVFSTGFGANEITLAESETLALTWNGLTSTSWVTATNWTPNGAPSDITAITIPDAATTGYGPTIPAIATCGTMEIQSGGILNASDGAQLTVNGASGAWINHGTFNPGTNSTVVFKNSNATMDGSTDFNNVTIFIGAVLVLENNTYMGITGAITNNGTLRTVIKGGTTVEYKGGAQTVVVPNPATKRYSTLILSGSGTKTMPAEALNIEGDFSVSGTASATAGNTLNVFGNVTIGTGASFETGSFSHSVGGSFSNTGTFTSTGSTITFNGTSTGNTISGSLTGASKFNVLTFNGIGGEWTLSDNTEVGSTLNITNGMCIVAAGKYLTATAGATTLSNPECLVLKASSPGVQSSFIDNGTISGSGTAKVELYLSPCVGGGTNFKCWHYVTQPITNALAGVFYGDYMRSFDETALAADAWKTITSGILPLNVTQGYAVSAQDNGEIRTFTGTLNTGGVDGITTPSLTRTAPVAGKGYGWNLVGNPFPSPIDLSLASTTDPSAPIYLNNVESKFYYLDQSLGNYLVYLISPATDENGYGTGTRYPLSMQGFFVHVPASDPDVTKTGTITFKNTARTTAFDADYYKNMVPDLLRLKAEGNTGMGDNMIICFRPDATNDYDNDFDCSKLYGDKEAPQLYSVTPGASKLTINALPFAGINTVVPLEFSVETNGAGNYSITASDLESFRSGTTITLEDKKTQTTQELNANPVYNFSYAEGDNPARFLLHFFNPFFGINDQVKDNGLPIYSYGHDVYLKDLSGKPEKGEMFIYNMMGQEIIHKPVSANSLNKYTVNLPNGYYIVRVITKEKAYCGKVYLD